MKRRAAQLSVFLLLFAGLIAVALHRGRPPDVDLSSLHPSTPKRFATDRSIIEVYTIHREWGEVHDDLRQLLPAAQGWNEDSVIHSGKQHWGSFSLGDGPMLSRIVVRWSWYPGDRTQSSYSCVIVRRGTGILDRVEGWLRRVFAL